jgi:hypothetical protein
MMKRLVVFVIFIICICTSSGYSQDFRFDPPELAGPRDTFAVMGRDAVKAVWMLRRAMFIQQLQDDGSLQTVRVHRARIWQVAEGLYTIYINGEALDWDSSYIYYDGQMRNLRVLFSYRNQPHPFDNPLYISQ